MPSFPTIKYLARAPHLAIFTAARHFEFKGDIATCKYLGAGFVGNAEVERDVSFALSLREQPERGQYQNYRWYIGKRIGRNAEG